MDSNGSFNFQEGVLVEAMRNGHWIILDELNLAPTEVLESLNRVLDDNRELFITETQTLIAAHPNFRLFATQNPPGGNYGGRKLLSRAFRNRFIQLHFDELPTGELETIIEKKCDLPYSMSKKMVRVLINLRMHRRQSATFEGNKGYITLRDLFRWGNRFNTSMKKVSTGDYYDWNAHLAEEGFMVLASRIRHPTELELVTETIEKILKVKLPGNLLTFDGNSLAASGELNFLKGYY